MASAAAEAATAGERRTTAAGQAESTLVPTSNPHLRPLQSLMRVFVLQVNYPEKVTEAEALGSYRLQSFNSALCSTPAQKTFTFARQREAARAKAGDPV
jgi:hypothetical protein